MTVLLLVVLFCARRLLQGCLSWIVALAVLGWVYRYDPFIVKDIRDLMRELINGW
jgi:type IV secretory pathway TrbD component